MVKTIKLVSTSLAQTKSIAGKLSRYLKPGDVLALIGNLGSGKTVFVKGLAQGLGCSAAGVSSPTFVLLRQYRTRKYLLNHFDLYRLRDIRQLLAIGYEEYFYGDGITAIEWADKIKGALPLQYLAVEFAVSGPRSRSITFKAKGKRYEDYLRNFKGKKPRLP